MPGAVPTDRLPLVTLVALFVGYACSYCHRADLAVLAPLWANDGARAELRAALPDIASLGMLVYALGKVLGGLLAERIGGRRLFVAALAGAGGAELLAAQATTPAAFAACRVAGMLVLGCAWPAVGHVVAGATPRARLATVMAFLSQSYLVGDAAVRAVLAAVVAGGGGAREVLHTATTGLVLAALVTGIALLCSHRPQANVPRVRAASAGPEGGGLVRLLLALAAMNFALAVVREAMSLWTPSLLVAGGDAPDDAVRASALLPLVSGVGALLAGPLADRGPRALLCATVLPALVGAVAFALLAATAPSATTLFAGLAVASAATAMPMTLASGVLPLRAAATGGARRLGLVDGAGSFGAVFAGGALARIQDAAGTTGMFAALAAVAFVAAGLAIVVHRAGRRRES